MRDTYDFQCRTPSVSIRQRRASRSMAKGTYRRGIPRDQRNRLQSNGPNGDVGDFSHFLHFISNIYTTNDIIVNYKRSNNNSKLTTTQSHSFSVLM